jgi:hypothetical protein
MIYMWKHRNTCFVPLFQNSIDIPLHYISNTLAPLRINQLFYIGNIHVNRLITKTICYFF